MDDRRIEWTGERCVPWADDLQVIYEWPRGSPLARGCWTSPAGRASEPP